MSPEIKAYPFLNKIPERFRKPVYGAIAAFAVSASVGGVCGKSEMNKNPSPDQSPHVNSAVLGGQGSDRFLSFPFKGPDSDYQIAQGWVYKGVFDGKYHGAIDFVQGTDKTNSDTWNKFPVLAAADGKACAETFDTNYANKVNYTVREYLTNGYETRDLHLDGQSVKDQNIPNCILGEVKGKTVKRGDILGEASDTGTFTGWYHLHFEVYDPQGSLVDPFDIKKTYDMYPDLAFTNGIACGPNALFIECEGKVSNPKPKPTLEAVPTKTAEAQPLDLSAEDAIRKYMGTQDMLFDEACNSGEHAYCAEWIASVGNSRLYEVGAGDGLEHLSATKQEDGSWQVKPENLDGSSLFQKPVKEFSSWQINDKNGVKFGPMRIFEYPFGVYGIEMEFENDTQGSITWTSDVGNKDIYVTDEAGNKTISSLVVGKLAEDLGQMPKGVDWEGWHFFRVGHETGELTLHYPNREPVIIELNQPQ